jgi:signal transduction histidine kinase
VVPRLARWSDERPITADACLAVLLLVAFVLPSDLSSEDGGWGDVAVSTLLLACVPFRRRAPVATFAVVSVICLAQIALLDHIVAGDVVALIALYTIVAYGPGTRVGVAATACAALGAALGTVRWERADGVTLVETAVTTVVSCLLAATLGAWRRSRRAQLEALEERNRLLAQERDQQAAVGAALERARIARELHDVVAHSLSVIVVQADGAAAGAEQRPAAAAAALRTIGETGREALAQMRRLLGVLRAEGGTELAPQPGAAQLDALVAQVAKAGVPAALTVEGKPVPIAAEVGVTVYRLAQEALTNVLKHGGRVDHVDVVLGYREGAVELLVRDDGAGGAPGDGGGHGLVGMRERVDLHHGTLAAGPRDGGGFEVHAVIPVAS